MIGIFPTVSFLFKGLPIALLSRDYSIADAWKAHNDALKITSRWGPLKYEYGVATTVILITVFQDALALMERVEIHVLKDDTAQEVVTFMVSLTTSFNMIGVAGAIMAQVAITALSLDSLQDAHWTAEAMFIASLVTGALSVFFACVVQPAVIGLHSAEDIKDWLSKPLTHQRDSELSSILKRSQSALDHGKAGQMPPYDVMMLEEELDQGFHRNRWKVASAYSAMMLVAPSKLLAYSLQFFVSGLGLYLGLVYGKNLIPSFGHGGQMALLIVFALVTTLGLALFWVPKAFKSVESFLDKKFANVLQELHLYRMTTFEQSENALLRQIRSFPQETASKASTYVRDTEFEPLTSKRTQTDTTLAVASGGIITKSLAQQPKSPTMRRQRPLPPGDGPFESALEEFIRAQECSARAAQNLLDHYKQTGK